MSCNDDKNEIITTITNHNKTMMNYPTGKLIRIN